jgi:hypothetical protein
VRPQLPQIHAPVFTRAVLVPALLLALVSCDKNGAKGAGLKGSGTLKTDTRAVTGFTQIALASSGDVTLAQGATESLAIEAEDNLLPHLTSAVAGGKLTLDTDASLSPTKPIHYTITVKDLTGIEVSGAGNVTATQLHASAVTVRLSGAGDVTLSGQADSEDVALSGAGDFEAAKLTAKTAKVVVEGAGNAVVNATDALDVKVSGVGNVEYLGDPKVTKNISGVGAVRKR